MCRTGGSHDLLKGVSSSFSISRCRFCPVLFFPSFLSFFLPVLFFFFFLSFYRAHAREEKNLKNVPTNGRQNMGKLQTSAFDTLCLRRVKEDRQQQKGERSREEGRREGGNQTGSKEYPE